MVVDAQEIIDIIQKIRISLENGSLPLEKFPLDELTGLIDITMGEAFWKTNGNTEQEAFQRLPEGYGKLLQHCMERGDGEACITVLELLEIQYKCFCTVVSKKEKEKFANRFRAMVLVIGNAYCEEQYRKHMARRKPDEAIESVWKDGKGAVYTCILKGKMTLQQPEYINVFWDYICFTDQEDKWGTKDGVWEYRKLPIEGLTDEDMVFYTCMAKPHIMLPEYDYSIWINPKMKIVGELEKFCEFYGKDASFIGFPSYYRDDIYTAMQTSIRDDDGNINMRKKKLQYKKEGYPEHNGIIENDIMVRNHRDEKMIRVMETWWNEAKECPHMRELGFNYAAWKNDFDFAICDLFVECNSYVKNMQIDLEIYEEKRSAG